MTPPTTRQISTLLVANRGEIAVRIFATARRMGLGTVAVYSDADREAPHVRAADTATRIGPTPASASYLDVDAVVEAARRTGADAVHPGYGFLSERAAFARAVTDAGLTFVGPPAAVMERMGRKDAAREVARAAGVSVVPSVELPAEGSDADAPDLDGVVAYPLLVKAAAGGGGKGMRIVRDPADFPAALAAARREALGAFGDDTMLVERYVERGRHVEVQVLADGHGSVVHLFERDCSTQRRHQKVIEEAPAPTISAGLRRSVTDSAVALAREAGYVNAGTVEFLVDTGADEEVAYFLEMNTRLQVEHPVTELAVSVGGAPLDLVEQQLRVASGEPLAFTQDDVQVVGHAIEARVYAEDAFAGFLPQAGTAELVRWSARARVDAALESGQVVSTAYDPMLGKVVAAGPTREAARRALVSALDDTAILGLTTNLGFLRELAASEPFRDCEIDTSWLDRFPDAVSPQGEDTAAVLAAWAVATGTGGTGSSTSVAAGTAGPDGAAAAAAAHPFAAGSGWRVTGPPASIPVELVVGDHRTVLTVDLSGSVASEGQVWSVHPIASHPISSGVGVLRLEVEGLVHEAAVRLTRHGVDVAHRGHTFHFPRPDAFGPSATSAVSDGTVTAPMPGTVLAVTVAAGQRVERGEVLGALEAMKMELTLPAPTTGTVTAVTAVVGEQVALGAVLFLVEPDEED